MPMSRTWPAGWLRRMLVIAAVLALLSADLGLARVSFAKEIDVNGTVDCGLPSGKRCSIGDTLVLRTSDITGELAPATIDVSWIRDKLPGLDQDDEITLSVEVLPNGKLQALSIVNADKRSGTVNQGQVTGSNETGISRRTGEGDDDDHDNTGAGPNVVPPVAPPAGTGALAGTVQRVSTGERIAGATVRIGNTTASTNANGEFGFGNLAPGSYQAEVSAPGFVTQTQTVTIVAGSTTQATFNLIPALPGITLNLTWGAQPPDLDAHLSGPAPGGGRFHAFFVNPSPVPYVELTIRDVSGPGLEQIVIRRDPATGLFVPGDYHFWVHNFSGTPEFDVSQAQVTVARDAQPLGTFSVSNATGDPRMDIWYVVNLQIDQNGNVTLTPVQQFTTGADLTQLTAPPYGPKNPRP